MDLSPIGRAAIRAREGERLAAYRDSKGILTISVGVTTASGLITVTPGLTLTPAQSDALFAQASQAYAGPVARALTRPVPQPFFDACVSLAYNVGVPGFLRSTVLRHANAGRFAAAAEAFLMWDKPAEIVGRRQGERDQAGLATYDAGAVYARRGDRAPVRAATAPASAPAAATAPVIAAPIAKPASASPVPIVAAGTAPAVVIATVAAPAAPAPTGLLARLRVAFPLTPVKKA